MERKRGRVTTIYRERGFGFLLDDDGAERFFHKNLLRVPADFDACQANDVVTFTPVDTAKGKRATDVERVA